MNAMLLTFILLAGVAQTPSTTSSYAVAGQPVSPVRVEVSSQPDIVTSAVFAAEDPFLGGPVSDRAQDTVLVIPTPELSAESLADLTEDLAVMCRIFDKAVPATRASTGFAYGNRGEVFSYGYGDRGDVLYLPFGPQSQRTQGLYLDGYGALFFIPVNYPLLPTEPPEQAQAQSKEPADTVWSQTVKEMSGQPGEQPQSARTAPAYDAQRVENLKKTLIKTLAHASNLRMRRPQDVLTLVVGALDESRSLGSWSRVGTRPYAAGSGSGGGGTSSGSGGQSVPARLKAPGNPASGLLVLRVTKADVDGLAKGQLTSAQFAEKVQSLWSPIDRAKPTTGPASAAPGIR